MKKMVQCPFDKAVQCGDPDGCPGCETLGEHLAAFAALAEKVAACEEVRRWAEDDWIVHWTTRRAVCDRLAAALKAGENG